MTSIAAANALIATAIAGTYTHVYLERGTYSALETIPFTIPQGITMQTDPAAGITNTSEVTLLDVLGGASGVQLDGTLEGVTVTCSGAAAGTCPGVLVRMDEGAPDLEGVAVIGPPGANGVTACVDADTFPNVDVTATVGAGTSVSGCKEGIRVTNGGTTASGPTTLTVDVTGATISGNGDGIEITPVTQLSVSVSGSTISGNTGDGITVDMAGPSGLGTFSLSVGDSSCGNAIQNRIFCNGAYGIENQTSLVLSVDDDQFINSPPTEGTRAAGTVYDLNNSATWTVGNCTSPAHGACATCPPPTNPLYVSVASAGVTGNGMAVNGASACPFATITDALAASTSALNTIDVEPGTYSAETFPLTIPQGVTVEADPATVSDPSEVVIDGPDTSGAFPWTVHLAGTLSGVTVTDTYAASCGGAGNCGALIRMDEGTPTLESSVLEGVSLPDGGPLTNAGITMNVATAGDTVTCLVSQDSITGFSDGIRFTVGNDGTLDFAVTNSEVSLNTNDGLNVTAPQAGSTLTLGVSGTTVSRNGHDGVQVGVTDRPPAAVPGTLNLTLGDAASCGASTDNVIVCNAGYAVENDTNDVVVDLSADQFDSDPPTAAATASYVKPAAPTDLNVPGTTAFTSSCSAAAYTSCP